MKRIVFILVAAALALPACDTETLHIGPMGDADSDTAELTDADTDAMDAADTPPDGDEGDTTDSDEDAQPESGVTVTMTNAGSDAAYVRNLWAGMDDHYGFTLWNDQGEQMHFDGGCLSTCEACSPIDCEALPEEVRQILPGDSVTMHWDGAYYRDGRCPYNENTSLQCRDRQQAAQGTYTLRFCYFPSLAPLTPQQTRYERRHGDIIGPLSTYAYPDDAITCLTTEVTLGDEPLTKQGTFTADAPGVGFFAFGYCGQAWQYAPMSYVGIMDPLPDISQGSSALIPVQTMLGGTPYPCAEFGGMRYTRRDDDSTINLHSGLWGGVESCGDDASIAHHTFVIPPPEPGLWHVYQELMVGAAIAPVDFTVTECPECIQCPELTGAPLGNSCVADCGCADAGAVCGWNRTCQIHCLDNRQCPAGYVCALDPSAMALLHTCRPMEEVQCSPSGPTCGYGYVCSQTGRCLPEFDMRAQGMRCGCDVECPGLQSCVRFSVGDAYGMCAQRCRDNRDCPDTMACMGPAETGMEAVCIPYMDR